VVRAVRAKQLSFDNSKNASMYLATISLTVEEWGYAAKYVVWLPVAGLWAKRAISASAIGTEFLWTVLPSLYDLAYRERKERQARNSHPSAEQSSLPVFDFLFLSSSSAINALGVCRLTTHIRSSTSMHLTASQLASISLIIIITVSES
jgi:hypothetical protein